MEPLFWIFVGIAALFFVILGIREFLNKRNKERVCSICAAVSLTWIFLLVLYWLGNFNDKVILSLLIGMSILGVFYLWERKVKERIKVFRLPFLLTLVLIVYTLIESFSYGYSIFILIGVLWILFFIIYLYGSEGNSGGLLRKIVECCKNW